LLAFLDGVQGKGDGAALLERGIAYAESKGFTSDVIGGRALLANLLHRSGRLAEARLEYERARDAAAAAEHRLVFYECRRALATLASIGAGIGPTWGWPPEARAEGE